MRAISTTVAFDFALRMLPPVVIRSERLKALHWGWRVKRTILVRNAEREAEAAQLDEHQAANFAVREVDHGKTLPP